VHPLDAIRALLLVVSLAVAAATVRFFRTLPAPPSNGDCLPYGFAVAAGLLGFAAAVVLALVAVVLSHDEDTVFRGRQRPALRGCGFFLGGSFALALAAALVLPVVAVVLLWRFVEVCLTAAGAVRNRVGG
jgi:hypothetical protein